jgi:hypothetical protein
MLASLPRPLPAGFASQPWASTRHCFSTILRDNWARRSKMIC